MGWGEKLTDAQARMTEQGRAVAVSKMDRGSDEPPRLCVVVGERGGDGLLNFK